MDGLARSEHRGNATTVDAMVMERLSRQELDTSWTDPRISVTLHSGLPLRWRGKAPLSVTENGARNVQLTIKRAIDVVVAALALIALFPLLTLVALLTKATSNGPVLFKQQREGINGQMFDAFKFRSMRLDECDPTGVAQTMKDDPRVTTVGKFIRRTSIDELPQLFNVLRGDMSLVGPRPHVAGMRAGGVSYKVLVPYYDHRLVMRPGITGWAQANGFRGPTVDAASAIARVDHDVAYVQNFSLWLDVKIIAKTVIEEFVTGSGH